MELWGLGDLIISTPFIRAASERYAVTLVAKPYARDLQKRFWPDVNVVPFVAPWTAFQHKYQLFRWPWSEILRLRRNLARQNFDVGVSARWDPRDHLLLTSVAVRRRIGFPRAGSQLFLNNPLIRPTAGSHRYEHWRKLAKALDLQIPDRQDILLPAKRKGIVLVHSGAAQRVRVWPLERFRKTVDQLRRAGFAVHVACDPDQRSSWRAMGEQDVLTAETVGELLAIIDKAAVFIGNDSGPGHLAAFSGVPTYTLFGPQLPDLFAPLHPASEWTAGHPCPYKPCSDYCRYPVPHCLWGLEFEAVWPAINTFIMRHSDTLERTSPQANAAETPRPCATDNQSLPARKAPLNGNHPIRVLHINNSADIYGASRNLLRYLRHVDRKRIQPLVLLPEDGILRKLFEAEGIEVIIHPRLSVITRRAFHSWRLLLFFLNYPVSVFYLWRLIRQRKIAVVHTNTGVMVSPAMAAWLARVPHVWHIRDWFQEFHRIWPVYSWYIKRFSATVIAVSNAIADQFQPRGRMMIVHDGLALEEFTVSKESLRREFRSAYGLGNDFVVGCVGRIKLVRKGQEVLIQATAVLKDRGYFVRAVIVGAPFQGNEPHLEEMKTMARQLGVSDRVLFTGELEDSRAAYAAIDMLALTSAQPEPFGTVVMESMAMGVPVVATNIGGSLDQVVDGETGFLVPPASPAALADAIEKLMQNPELRQQMSAAAVERIRSKFSLAEMTRDLENFFEKTATTNGKRAA